MASTSFWSDPFPAGLRVLVVDDDSAWLKIFEKRLIKCNYQATICNLAQEALDLIEKRKDGFDIVISDVNLPDMDCFVFLDQVGRLNMNLPLIMMSVDGDASKVLKAVQHGACDYLLKPIRAKELRNIWQHVVRRRMHDSESLGAKEGVEETRKRMHDLENSEETLVYSTTDDPKKRKDNENADSSSSSSMKKARVVWTTNLHDKFLEAVEQLGLENVGPKKILDLMGVPWLSRENVASHLQKYRLHLLRKKKENEVKTVAQSMYLQSGVYPNSLTLQQNIVINENYGGLSIHEAGGVMPVPYSWNGGAASISQIKSEHHYNHFPLVSDTNNRSHAIETISTPQHSLLPHLHYNMENPHLAKIESFGQHNFDDEYGSNQFIGFP